MNRRTSRMVLSEH